jgi:hypothetical protein
VRKTVSCPGVGSVEWRRQTAKAAANARHDRPGGSREIMEIFRFEYPTADHFDAALSGMEEIVDSEEWYREAALSGLTRRKAASHFAVGISTVINWIRRFREADSILNDLRYFLCERTCNEYS